VLSLGGEDLELAEILGEDKETLLVFMTSYCEVCRREQPSVEAFARAKSDSFRVYQVISGASLESARVLAEERRMQVELLVDESGALATHLGVRATPTLLWFDSAGQLRGTYHRIEDVPVGRQVVMEKGVELGTSYDVLVVAADPERARGDLAEVRELCRTMEARLSQWREDSEVSVVNREASSRPVRISSDLQQLLEGALHVSRVTVGAFDVTWRPLEDAGRGNPPTSMLEDIGWRHVRIENGTVSFDRPGTRIGIDGVAKGWIIDALYHALRAKGYEDVLVNIGGDLRTSGRDERGEPRVFRVADPFDITRTACEIEIQDLAVATSGNYIRFTEADGVRRGHIVDPRSGRQPVFDGSVTVLTRDAAMADALATALFVMGPEEGMGFAERTPGVDAIFVTRDGVRSTLGAALRRGRR
jgi:thiamine biosynthesis lipoprotein